VENVGYLAHGPDEKYALSGRITGFFFFELFFTLHKNARTEEQRIKAMHN
jgi:hypothetical protein